MHSNHNDNVFTRDDTFFGVCQAIGEDLGFNPNWLRAALGGLLIWTPLATIAAYLAAGLVIAAIRWLVPNPAFAKAMAGEPAPASAAPAGDNDAIALAEAA